MSGVRVDGVVALLHQHHPEARRQFTLTHLMCKNPKFIYSTFNPEKQFHFLQLLLQKF